MTAAVTALPTPTKAPPASHVAVRVLSGPNGPHPAKGDLKDKVCLLDNDELHIVSGTRMNDDVLAYESELKRKGVRVSVRQVSLVDLRELYQQMPDSAQAGGEQVSGRQGQVLKYIQQAVARNASDMHFVVGRDLASIRSRVHGDLQKGIDMPAHDGMELCSTIYQSMCDVAEPTFNPKKPQDGRLKQEFLEAAGLYGARIATRPTERGVLMILRLLYNKSATRRGLEDLGYLPVQAAMIRLMTQRRTGVNIFSGETGSGKSSSLEVVMRMIDDHFQGKLHILTIEDPPEYVISGANQTPKGDRDWADAIKNAMRLDPNIIMVGEVRDYVSAEAALTGALTGHALWTTMHTTDATAILQRLKGLRQGENYLDEDLYLDPSLVTGLINQNLVAVMCPHCKLPWSDAVASRIPQDQRDRISAHCDLDRIYRTGPGCPNCDHGTVSRTVVAEVVVPNLEFMRVFRTKGKAEARAYWIEQMGGITKTQCLIQRINEGKVDPVMGEQHVGLLDEDERL